MRATVSRNLWLQRITTRGPNDAQAEVAVGALHVLVSEDLPSGPECLTAMSIAGRPYSSRRPTTVRPARINGAEHGRDRWALVGAHELRGYEATLVGTLLRTAGASHNHRTFGARLRALSRVGGTAISYGQRRPQFASRHGFLNTCCLPEHVTQPRAKPPERDPRPRATR